MTEASDAHDIWRWRIGAVTITRILELAPLTVSTEWLLKTTTATALRHAWLQPEYVTPDGRLKALIQAFVIEAGDKRILVDPCIGNDKPRTNGMFSGLRGPFLERLAAAGFPPETIDVVLCTHLHVDHCGWNTRLVDGRWVPTFPNARYLFARVELEHAAADTFDDQDLVYADSIQPVIAAGQAEIIEFDHRIVGEVTLRPTPGHTPGHCSIVITSEGETAIITGDMIHHPLQACEPDVCSNFCAHDAEAIATRRATLDWCAENGVVLFGSHFAGPTAVRVTADGTGWRLMAC